ncbi:MAG TPA: hypothetical protein VGL55_12860 [Steroidobacteraceae bacterium]|jgi:hypothetical protein
MAAAQAAGGPTVFRQDISGNNGAFVIKKKKAYNEVLGNGTVFGTAFLGKPNMKTAGNPQTPTNP